VTALTGQVLAACGVRYSGAEIARESGDDDARSIGEHTIVQRRPVMTLESKGLIRACLSVAALVLVACAAEHVALTQLVLVADTDIDSLDKIVFSVRSPDGHTETARGDAKLAPLTVSMVLGSAVEGVFEVRATGYAGVTAVVHRDARVAFLPGQTRAVPLHLVQRCAGVRCGAGQTCTERGCESTTLDAELLPRWDGVPEGLDADRDPVRDSGTGGAQPSTPDASSPADAATDPRDAGLIFHEDAGASGGDAGVSLCSDQTVDLSSDVRHCGACERKCAVDDGSRNFESTCVGGTCAYECRSGFGNCDIRALNGCETDLSVTRRHCGRCGHQCVGASRCVAGRCI
jgi:hypothetical protein